MTSDVNEPNQTAYSPRKMRENERVSIEERVQRLYAQSGGPEKAAARIDELMKRHLLNGKDHGPRGRMETYEDVLKNMFQEDRSLRAVHHFMQKLQVMGMMFYQTRNQKMDAVSNALAERNRILEQKLSMFLDVMQKRAPETWEQSE